MSQHRTPKYALYSGFEMSREDLQTFVRSIPRLRKFVKPTGCPDSDLEDCIEAYKWWALQVDPRMPRLISATMMFYYMTGSSF
jgi:hypothetical protein